MSFLVSVLLLCQNGYANHILLRQSIEESRQLQVVVDDVLGDRDGFDTDPMHVTTHVNCMIWLQWVVSRYYAKITNSTQDIDMIQQDIMNEIRYFQKPYTYGNRIHYVDRWVFVQNNFFVPNGSCPQSRTKNISLPLDNFFQQKNWNGDIYLPEARHISFPYSSNEEFLTCLSSPKLPDGYYLVFPVANENYKTRWDIEGDIGLVHSMILEKTADTQKLWHASIDMGQVIDETPEGFVHRIQSLIDGYVIVDIHVPSYD